MRQFRGGRAIWPLFLLGVGFSAPAHASDARLDALAVQREYVEDYALVSFFPTVATRYGNLVTGSVGIASLGDYSVGILAGGRQSNYGTFGVFLNRQNRDSRNAQVDMVWAKQFRTVAFGLGTNITTSRFETDNSVVSPERYPADLNQTAVTAGVNLDLTSTSSLEGAVELAWLSWERTGIPGQPDTKSEGHASYRASVRMKKILSEQTALVPLLQFSHVDITAAGDPDDSFSEAGNLGAALHHRVNERDLLIGGLALNYWKRQAVDGVEAMELTRWDLPSLFLALEFRVSSWLTGRVGATKTLDVTTAEDGSESLESRFFFGLGLGIHAEHFDIDASLNPDAVHSGAYVISGQETELLKRITMTYYF